MASRATPLSNEWSTEPQESSLPLSTVEPSSELPPPSVTPSTDDSQTPDGVESILAAGGSTQALASLTGAELTIALKKLGFKGLATRKRLEVALKKWKNDNPGL